MSFFDLTSEYKSAPSTPEPDPFANYVEPNAGPTTANYSAWGSTAPSYTPTPYTPAAPAPPKEPTYNYQYDTWQDESGRLWDRSSGLWYSIEDPNNPLVYRPSVGWQSIPQYNDYNSVLNELGQFSANPLVAQPSTRQLTLAEWQQIDNYKTNQRLIEAMPGLQEHDQFQYATREDNINRLMQGGYTRQEAESLPDSVAEDRARLMDRVQYARDQGQGASLSDFLGGLLGPGMQGLGLLNKYVSTPVEETLSQLTPAMLAGLKYVAPGGQQAALAADWLTGYRPEDRLLGGLKDLGSAAKDSGGNPLDFIDIQNKNFEQRPTWQQVGAQVAYDPLNLLGTGLGAKALETGALEGSGVLSAILRAGAKVDRGVDLAQQTVFKPLGDALTPLTRTLAGEEARVAPILAAKLGVGAGAGAYGYATGDGMDPEARFARALGFAAVPTLGPDAANILARSYGKLPLFEAGLGRKTWLEKAPIAEALEEKNLNPAIYLKDVTDRSGLPLRSKISNAFWGSLEKLGRTGAAANIDDERIYWIASQHRFNEGRIAEVAENSAKTAGESFAREFALDEKGRVLNSEGKYLPAMDKDGNTQMFRGKQVYGATPADIADHADTYLARGLISQPQYDALRAMAEAEQEATALRLAFGLPFEPSPTVGADGFHLTRGRSATEGFDETATRPREARQEGRTPGGAKERKYQSEAAAILDGKEYPHPIDALRSYIDQSLREVNAANSSNQLAKLAIDVELSSGKQVVGLGSLLRNDEQGQYLAGLRKDIAAGKREIRKLTQRQTRIDRDYRLGSAWVETNRNRVERLSTLLTDQSISATSRAEVAHDALALTRTALSDARQAAADYSKQTAKAAIKESDARKALGEVLTEGGRISRSLNEIEDQIRNGEFADLQQKFADAWNYADTIRNATAADAAALERRLADLPYDDVSAGATAAKDALARAKGNFSGSLGELRKQEAAAVRYAQQEANAAANVRATLNSGRVSELNRLVEQRSAQLEAMAAKSNELLTHIGELKEKMLPLEQSRAVVQDDIRRTQELAKEMAGKFPGGTIKLKGWENVHMPHALANAWTKYEKSAGKFHAGGEIFDLVNNAFRAIGATADASRTATVGLLGLSEKPSTSIEGVRAGVRAAKDPESAWHSLRAVEDAAKADGIDVPLSTAVGKHRLEIASSEHLLHGMADEGTLAARVANAPFLRQAEALYSTPGNIERAQRFYDNLRVLRARGEDWTSDSARAAAANAANVTTGRATRGVLAPLVGERASSRIAFAGRFVQSQFDSLYNAILVGGIEGETSRRALLRLFGGATALTYAINEGLGNKTDFNIYKDGKLNPDFMKIRVLGQDISLFGPWESLVKGVAATAQGNPDYFIRGKLAPAAGILWDVGVNRWRDPLDRPIDSKQGLERMLPFPFGLRSIADQALHRTDYTDPASLAGLGLSVGTSMLGIKSSPLTPREQYTETLRNAYDDHTWEKWREGAAAPNYPKPSDVYDDPLFIQQYASAHPGDVPGPATELGKQMASIREEKGGQLDAINSKFANDGMTIKQWKEQRSRVMDEQRVLLEPLIKKMNEATGHDPEEGSPAWWMNRYYENFKLATDPETGQIDPDNLDRALDLFRQEIRDKGADWVTDYINQYTLSKADPGPEREYAAARQKLEADGYFDGKLPRYIGLSGSISEDDIRKAKGIIDGYAEQHPELTGADTLMKAIVILKPRGYTMEQIADIANSGKKAHENPMFVLYKARNPGLIEWMDDGNYYSTIKYVSQR